MTFDDVWWRWWRARVRSITTTTTDLKFVFRFDNENEKRKKIKYLFHFKTKIECPFRPTDSDCSQSVYRKYNSFFDLKAKRISKIFHFSFFNFKTKIDKWKNFLKFIFLFQIKNEFENFDFCFSKLVLNQNRFKKIFFSILVFQFNNQIWKMKDIFWNSFFYFKPKNELQNCNLHFLKFVLN